MQLASSPITRDLVLVGGGHSHAIALKLWGMNPLPGVRLVLITETSHTPYSGMLPGYVAGFYSFDECHIDLRPLANFAGAQLILDRAIGLDLQNDRVLCANHPPIAFDVLSMNIGSTPATISVPGAAEYAIRAKPVSQFLDRWHELVDTVSRSPQKSLSLGIVGGGAGGVELALTMQARLSQILAKAGEPAANIQFHLIHRGAQLLSDRSPTTVRRKLQEILMRRGVNLHLSENVTAVRGEKGTTENRTIEVCCESGLTVECDRLFWVTQASAPSWLEKSGLATDSNGFILVGDTLQSISHPHIFAAGDIATMQQHPRPKAGVFAVRQGKPIFENWCAFLQERPLKPYQPQKHLLGLIGTGDGKAIASRGRWGLGPFSLLWNWKDRIDRAFMERFSTFPEMSETKRDNSSTDEPPQPMRCAGCGSKVGQTVLERVFQRLPEINSDEAIEIGLDAPDDAAVVRVPPDRLMVHTLDYFRSFLGDPYVFGQITAHHCLSDIFAMGATPQTALAMATIPYATDAKTEEILYQLLAGVMEVLNESQTALVGGHTTEGAELALGLACNGFIAPNALLKKGGMQPGDVLILTKALGTGTLLAADMQLQAKGRWIEAAVRSMLQSNREAAHCAIAHHATACTDVTGFGLLGHLLEMVRASSVAATLNLAAIPAIDGTMDTLNRGIFSSLYPQNARVSKFVNHWEQVRRQPRIPLLFDPQTSGGLLLSIPETEASGCIEALQKLGYSRSCAIGRVYPLGTENLPLKVTL
ncbi:MAG: selenide, water dikinase SelD [Cyanobacteriota bacterium]|nr:selenide, water dikinase SelD [Cyanobacteriota bacterium]